MQLRKSGVPRHEQVGGMSVPTGVGVPSREDEVSGGVERPIADGPAGGGCRGASAGEDGAVGKGGEEEGAEEWEGGQPEDRLDRRIGEERYRDMGKAATRGAAGDDGVGDEEGDLGRRPGRGADRQGTDRSIDDVRSEVQGTLEGGGKGRRACGEDAAGEFDG